MNPRTPHSKGRGRGFLLLAVVGMALGIGALIFGLKLLSAGLRRFGPLDGTLGRFANRPWQGVLLGAAVTALVHSSSAVTILIVGLVDAGVLPLGRAVPLIMGANIGTTITAHILATNPGAAVSAGFPWFLALAGVLLWVRNARWGEPLAGFGLIFLALAVLDRALSPLGRQEWFATALYRLADQPLLGVLAGAILTTLVMSSSVTIAVLQRLAGQGLIGLGAVLPVLCGDNIGTTADTLLASLATGRRGRAAALAHLLFNLAGTLIFLPLIPMLTPLLMAVSPDPPRQIAIAHTVFNVANTALLLPFVGPLARALGRWCR